MLWTNGGKYVVKEHILNYIFLDMKDLLNNLNYSFLILLSLVLNKKNNERHLRDNT